MPQTHHEQTIANLLENPVFQDGKPAKVFVTQIAGVNLIRLSIKAGDKLPSHHVNQAAFAVLLQGKADFTLEDQAYAIKQGAFIDIPEGAEHSVLAKEDAVFLVGIIGQEPPSEPS